MDVIVQKCIEKKTQDLEYIFSKCVVNNTSYNKGHRQTVYLINRMAADWYKMGYIIGNNSNRDNPKPPKYLGAIVGIPTNTDDYSKMHLPDGTPLWVCENLVDYDFKSLYPSIMGELYIAPNTQIGRIMIDEKVYNNENAYGIEESKYSRSGEFIENMVTDNYIEYCHRWFHLANINEILDDIDEYFNKISDIGTFSNLASAGYNDNLGVYSPIMPTTKDPKSPVRFDGNTRAKTPVTFTKPRDLNITYDKLIEGTKNDRY